MASDIMKSMVRSMFIDENEEKCSRIIGADDFV